MGRQTTYGYAADGTTLTSVRQTTGQPLTVTNAKGETTTSVYDADGRLQSITGAVSGATTTYTYDGYGRVRTVTDADGYTLTTDYDIFDRPIRTTYPDGTYEETTYDRLDVSTRRDRAGRVTRSYYDALRRLIGTRDPAGRVIAQEWCTCGSLDGMDQRPDRHADRELHLRPGVRAGGNDGRRDRDDDLHVSPAAPLGAGRWRARTGRWLLIR